MSDGIARGAVSQPQAAPRRALRLLVVSDEMEVGGSQRQISCLLRAYLLCPRRKNGQAQHGCDNSNSTHV